MKLFIHNKKRVLRRIIVEQLNIIVNESEIKEMGFIKRLINIIFEPRQVFDSIKVKSSVWVQVIFVIVCLVLLIIPKAPLAEQYSRQSIEKLYHSEKFLKTQQMSQDGANALIESQMKISKPFIFLGAIFGPLILLLISAGVFHGIFKLLRGGGSFSQTFSVVLYSYFINIIGEGVRTINVLLSGNYEATNSLGLLMSSDKTNFLFNFLNSLDVFAIWSISITAFGLSIVHNVLKKKSYVWVLSIWGGAMVLYAVYITIQMSALYKQYGITL